MKDVSAANNPLKHLTAEEREAVLFSLSTMIQEVRGDLNFRKAFRLSKTMDSERVVHAIEWFLDNLQTMIFEVFLELGQKGGKDGEPIEVDSIPVGAGDAKLHSVGHVRRDGS